MTLGVTIGMLIFASPQSFGSNVVLLSPPPLEEPLALTLVVGVVSEALLLDEPLSVMGVVVIDAMPVLLVVESLADALLPSSPHP